METKEIHEWNVDYKEAVRIQRDLAARVELRPLPKRPALVAGIDVSHRRGDEKIFSSVVVFDFESLEIVERVTAEEKASFPYIPGLLSFREGPVILKGLAKVETAPDLLIFDGQGLAHPRRFGLACHIGLISGKPSVGCAKTRLCGEYEPPGIEKGSGSPLLLEGEQVGKVVRTRSRVKPVFVSPGHLIDFEGAQRIVLSCCGRYRLPEPIREAHRLVNEARRSSYR